MIRLLYAPVLTVLLLWGLYLFLRCTVKSAADLRTAENRGRFQFVLCCYAMLAAGLLVEALLVSRLTLFFTLTLLALTPLAFRRNLPSWVYACGLLILLGGFYSRPIWSEFFQGPEPTTRPHRADTRPSIADRLRYEEHVERVALYSPEGVPQSVAPTDDLPPSLDAIERPLRAPLAPSDDLLIKLDYDQIDFDAAYFSYHLSSRVPASDPPQLSRVHQVWTKRFTQTMGFGVGRMPPEPEIEDPRSGYPDGRGPLPDEYTPADQFVWAVEDANRMQIPYDSVYAPRREDVDMHLRSKTDFLKPWFWKSVSSRENPGPPAEHGFSQLPVVIDRDTKKLDEWRVTQLHLVSLLKHESPRVYLHDRLPNMKSLRSDTVPTRELDRFERKSLRYLQDGYDVVIDEREDFAHMFGSLRATEQCLQCHAVPRGTLLGAFTYELTRPVASISQK